MQKELDDLVEQLRSYTSVTDTPDVTFFLQLPILTIV